MVAFELEESLCENGHANKEQLAPFGPEFQFEGRAGGSEVGLLLANAGARVESGGLWPLAANAALRPR
jgi:hypothetical protein